MFNRTTYSTVAITAAVLLSACGNASSPGTPLAATGIPAVTTPAAVVQLTPTATDAPTGTVGIFRGRYLKVYTNPEMFGQPKTVDALPHYSSNQHIVKVLQIGDKAVKVNHVGRPNGASGWVDKKTLSVVSTKMTITVNLKTRILTLKDGTVTKLSFPVAIGSKKYPTPLGQTYVTEALPLKNAAGPYGPVALGLAHYSNILQTFGGGPGQIGIHGTNQPNLLGQAVSHGCIRVKNSNMILLAKTVLPGTPVFIVAS